MALQGAYAVESDIERAISRGVSLYEFGHWTDARCEFERARGMITPQERVHEQEIAYYLAMCASKMHDPESERILLAFLHDNHGMVYANDVHFELAALYRTEGRLAESERELAKVNYSLLDKPSRQKYNLHRGYIEFVSGDYDAAYDYFDRMDEEGPYADHATYYKSYIHYLRGDYAQAKSGFRLLLRNEQYARLMPYYLLQIEFHEGNYRYVVNSGDDLVRQSVPEYRASLYRVISESWYRLGRFDKCLDYMRRFENAGGAMGRNENYIMGYALYRTAHYSQAREYLQKVCGADDALTQNASYHLADCYLRANNKRKALEAFAMASNERFDAAIAEDALFNYGKLQYELGGKFNESINVLNRYIATYPQSERVPAVQELLIAAYYNSHDYDAAYEAITRYPDPDNNIRAALQKIAYFRGLDCYNEGDLAQARQYLSESLEISISPKYTALASFWLGEIAFSEGDYAAALEDYRSYLQRAPRTEREYAMAHYNVGYCHFADRRMSEAEDAFDRFLSIYRKNDNYRADALNRYGDALFAQRRFTDAVAAYDKTIASGQNEKYYAQYRRALSFGVMGRNGMKIDALRSIVRTDRGDYVDDALYELGRTYISQEQYSSGAKVLENFVKDYPGSPQYITALNELGLAYLNMGDNAASKRCYETVVEKAPNSAEAKTALQGIREIYIGEGDVDSYFSYAEKAGVEVDMSQMARDSLSFVAARKIYLAGKYGDAVRVLNGYLKNYPRGYHIDDALFYLGDSYIAMGDDANAIATLTALSERPANAYTRKVLERLAQMTFAGGDYALSAKTYRRLYDAVQESAVREDAMLGYVRATVASGADASIIAMADDVASHDDAGADAQREALFAKGAALRRQGDEAGAMTVFRTLSADVQTKEGAESEYYVIRDLFDAGRTAEAEQRIFAFTEHNVRYPYWLAQAYLLLGDIYVLKGDLFQARATYQSVADGYSPADDGTVAAARERIAKLD